MTDKKTEVLKLALEALKQIDEAMPFPVAKLAQKAIREALSEQPAQQRIDYRAECWPESPHYKPAQQQEAVAWLSEGGDVSRSKLYMDEMGFKCEPLYTSPPASKPWVGLTDVEWMNIVNKDHAWFGQRPEDVAHEVAKLVEAKLKEKNQ